MVSQAPELIFAVGMLTATGSFASTLRAYGARVGDLKRQVLMMRDEDACTEARVGAGGAARPIKLAPISPKPIGVVVSPRPNALTWHDARLAAV